MTTSGPNSPATMANDTSTGTVAWLNVDNAKSSDDQYSTVVVGSRIVSNWLKATNFGFTIPTGATINGIQFDVEAKTSTGSIYLPSKRVINGVISGSEYNIGTFTTTEQYQTIGGSAELFGQSWTAEDINNSGFGFVVRCQTLVATISVDHMRTTIYYTGGTPPGTNLQVQVGDVFRPVSEIHVNVGDVWRSAEAYVNVGDVWRA